ncbi:MAG: TonB-dependent receptor, partial [Candidatus Firestonebacteria bacterium]
IKTPYASALGFSAVIKDFYTAYLRAASPLIDKLNLTSYLNFTRSDLSTFGVKNNELGFGIKTDYEIIIENKKHLPGFSMDLRNDDIFGWTYSAALEDRFKIDNADIFIALKSDNGWLFVNAKAVFDVDGFTRVFVSYEPGRVYPKFKSTYDNDIYFLKTGLRAENTWLSIGTGVEHRLLKQIPITLEFYRKEINDLLSYESTGSAASPVNISKASIIGVNVKEEWKIFDGLTQKLSYKYINASNPDNTAINVPYLPAHSAVMGGEYVAADWTFDVSFEYRGIFFTHRHLLINLPMFFWPQPG